MSLKDDPFFVATIIQILLYVLYLVSLGHALRWLLYEEEGWNLKNRNNLNWFMLTVTVFVCVLSTADIAIAITLQITFQGLDSMITQRLIIASLVVESTAMITVDAVLIFRCWLVYQKSWKVICYPVMSWLANIACMILWIVTYTISIREQAPPFLWMLAVQIFYLSNLSTNLYATSAIVYRVWRVARANNASILYSICRIVAGTGLLYTCTSLQLVVTAFLMAKNLPAYLICDGINFTVAGITFNLLLIRVGQLRAEIETDAGEHVSGTVLLSTVQFNFSTITSDERTHDSATLRPRDYSHLEKGAASS